MSPRPEISTIEPAAAVPGGEIVIRGRGLTADHERPTVAFGEVQAPVVISTESFLIARVPEAATSGMVTVGVAESSKPYEVRVGVQIAENLHPVGSPAVDAAGNVYTTFSGSRGQKVPMSLFKVDLNYEVKPFGADIMNPTGLALDRAGYLYASSRHDGTIFRVAPNGVATTWIEGMGIATGLAFDPEESLYVGDRSGTVFKISRDRQIFVFATLEPSISAYHLAFGPDGYLYLTGPTTSSYDNVYRISPAGEVEIFYRGLGRPQGLAFDVDSNLYVAASVSGRKGIVRITPDRQAAIAVAGNGLVGLAFTPGRALMLTSTNSLYTLEWPARGLPLWR